MTPELLDLLAHALARLDKRMVLEVQIKIFVSDRTGATPEELGKLGARIEGETAAVKAFDETVTEPPSTS